VGDPALLYAHRDGVIRSRLAEQGHLRQPRRPPARRR